MPLMSESCALTNSAYSSNDAHLIPRDEAEWFRYNMMGVYGLDRKDTEDSANMVSLRVDIHTWLDSRGWTIAPKPTGTDDGSYRYIAHVFDTIQAPEFYRYHNVELRLPGRAAREYLFARFAWTVIQLVKPFLVSDCPRNVVRVQRDPQRATKWVVEKLARSELDNLYGGGGSRSASPNKKRKQSSARNSVVDGSLNTRAETAMIYARITAEQSANKKRRRNSIANDAYNAVFEDWERRGRSRKCRSVTLDDEAEDANGSGEEDTSTGTGDGTDDLGSEPEADGLHEPIMAADTPQRQKRRRSSGPEEDDWESRSRSRKRKSCNDGDSDAQDDASTIISTAPALSPGNDSFSTVQSEIDDQERDHHVAELGLQDKGSQGELDLAVVRDGDAGPTAQSKSV